MSRSVALPEFPVAPVEYDPQYMAEVVRSFSVFLTLFNNPGDWRATTLVLTNLPQTDNGLENGGVFQVDGFLKISLVDKPHPAGAGATAAVGTVSVSTP